MHGYITKWHRPLLVGSSPLHTSNSLLLDSDKCMQDCACLGYICRQLCALATGALACDSRG